MIITLLYSEHLYCCTGKQGSRWTTTRKTWWLSSKVVPHPIVLVSCKWYWGLILHASTGDIVIYNSNLYLGGYWVCYRENNEVFEDKSQWDLVFYHDSWLKAEHLKRLCTVLTVGMLALYPFPQLGTSTGSFPSTCLLSCKTEEISVLDIFGPLSHLVKLTSEFKNCWGYLDWRLTDGLN